MYQLIITPGPDRWRSAKSWENIDEAVARGPTVINLSFGLARCDALLPPLPPAPPCYTDADFVTDPKNL